MNHKWIVLTLRSVLLILSTSIIISCGSSSGPTSTPAGSATPSGDSDRYKISSYEGKVVSGLDLQGVWIMTGDEQISISNSMQTRSGTAKRREIFAFKQSANIGEILMRTCGSNLWRTINTGVVSLPIITVQDTTYTPVTTTKINVTRNRIVTSPDETTSINGNYKAVKISSAPDANLGSLSLYAQITDFSSASLTTKIIANNDLFNIYCFTEHDSPVALGITVINDHSMQVYYEGGTSTTDENGLLLTTVTTSLPNPGYVVNIQHNGDSFTAAGDKQLITMTYNTNNASKLDVDFNASTPAIAGSADNAVGALIMNF